MRKVIIKSLTYIGEFSRLLRFGTFLTFTGFGAYAIISEKKKKKKAAIEKSKKTDNPADTMTSPSCIHKKPIGLKG